MKVINRNDLRKYDFVTECPLCGSDVGWYTRVYVRGWINDNRLFDTGEPYNTEMHDYLRYGKNHDDAFCIQCEEKIGKQIMDENFKTYCIKP